MSKNDAYATLAGRILLAAIFVISGFSKITGFEGTVGYMEAYGMPMAQVFLVGAIVLELGGGLMVLLGWKARLGALALIVFTIPTTLIFHQFWGLEDAGQAMTQQIMFMKNLSMIGGLLILYVHGAGALSLDHRARPG